MPAFNVGRTDAGMLIYGVPYRWGPDATGETLDGVSHPPRARAMVPV